MQICDCHIYQVLTTREDKTCCWGSAYTVFWITRCFVEGGSSFKAARTSSTFTEGEHVTIWASYPGSCPGNNLLMRGPYLNLTRLHAASVSSPYGRQGRYRLGRRTKRYSIKNTLIKGEVHLGARRAGAGGAEPPAGRRRRAPRPRGGGGASRARARARKRGRGELDRAREVRGLREDRGPPP